MGAIALLDANVLWSAAVRDTLLLAAERGLYRPIWTLQILDEMARNLKAKRPDLAPYRIDRTVSQMCDFFPDALVSGYDDLIPRMRNHEGDRHVLAAAVRGDASIIVTWNRSHFPPTECATYGIEVLTPDEFLCRLWDQNSAQMVSVLEEQSSHLVNPSRTPQQILETLQLSLPAFVQMALHSGLFPRMP